MLKIITGCGRVTATATVSAYARKFQTSVSRVAPTLEKAPAVPFVPAGKESLLGALAEGVAVHLLLATRV